MLRELLCTLTLLLCDPVQADVSAHTIMNLLRQTEGRADYTIPALGAFYESVRVESDSDDAVLMALLYRADHHKATLRCDTFLHPDAVNSAPDNNPKFEALLRAPLHDTHRARLSCTFSYFDDPERLRAFLTGAEIWAEHNLGELRPDPGPRGSKARIAHSAQTGETLGIISLADGPAPSAVLLWLADLSEE